MMRVFLLASLLTASLALSACKTSEEKAEDYYQSGLSYLAKGDADRALLEFRNTFKYNGFHKEARQSYADALVSQGKAAEAYGQYLRLIEQYPDTPTVRRTLAELAVELGNWDEVERHGRAALALTPDDANLQPIRLALDYRTAVTKRDEAARDAVADEALAMLKDHPGSLILRRIRIDRLISKGGPALALPEVDAAIALAPDRLDLQMMRFSLLMKLGRAAETGVQLKAMVAQFPDNTEVRGALISWYMSQKDFDGAEAFLRSLATDPKGPAEPYLALVQLLQTARGRPVALAELDRLITDSAGTPNAELFGTMRASLIFDEGDHATAITAVETILQGATASDQTRKIKAILARMLDKSRADDPAYAPRARILIEEVLAEDKTNVDGLKLRAAWAIAEDRSGDAIVDLRAALDQAPRDAQVLTLMASAHERDGDTNLVGERLAAAVEVSGAAAAESLRYAQFLMTQGRPQAMETVLTDARRVNPSNAQILQALAQYYIGQGLWGRAEEVLASMTALPLNEQGRMSVQRLRAASLAGQNRIDESLAILQEGISPGTRVAATLAIVQTHLRAGKPVEARRQLDKALAQSPKDPVLRLLLGNLEATAGKTAEAEAIWTTLMAEDPASEPPVRLLYGLYVTSNQPQKAAALLDSALAAQPGSVTLRWIRAGTLEKSGDIAGAIAIYETLYLENSSNMIVANNLASLLASGTPDAETLARAERISRRLREQTLPAYQDTYGWIALLNGDTAVALPALMKAAEGLPRDPLTQYHLGVAYERTGKRAEAQVQYQLALDLAGPDSPLPQIAEARAALDRLKAAP